MLDATGRRRDTVVGLADVAFLRSAPCALGAAIVVVMGDGTAFCALPPLSHHAAWGALMRPWTCLPLFQHDVALAGRTPHPTLNDTPVALEQRHADGHRDRTPAKRRRRLTGELHTPLVSSFPENQVLSVAFTRLLEYHRGLRRGTRHYVVFGRKDGAILYQLRSARQMETLSAPLLTLHTGWSSVIECLPAVFSGSFWTTLVAVGGAFGDLHVYALWLDDSVGDVRLGSKLLWKAEQSTLFGSVSSLSWSFGHPSQPFLRLAVASGESVAIVDWPTSALAAGGEQFWATPEFNLIGEAHEKLVSSVQVLLDGSVVSSALNGQVCVWKLSANAAGAGKERTVSCTSVRRGPGMVGSVMAMQRSVNGFGVVLITSNSRTRAEVEEEDDDAKNKYGASARRTLISLCIQPPSKSLDAVKNHVFSRIDGLVSTARDMGQPINLWDMELFMGQFEPAEEEELLMALRERFYEMVERVKLRKFHGWCQEMFEHYSRVALALGQLVKRIGGRDIEAIEALDKCYTHTSNAVRTFHYDACLASFLAQPGQVSLSVEECRALECICQFVSTTKRELLWNAAEIYSRVEAVREQLAELEGGADASMVACGICASERVLPLVSDAADATSFYCAEGDSYSRCVLTGLPVMDAVPLVCDGCDVKALAEGFDGCDEKGGKFGWIVDVGRCPLCLCMLLPSSVEIL